MCIGVAFEASSLGINHETHAKIEHWECEYFVYGIAVYMGCTNVIRLVTFEHGRAFYNHPIEAAILFVLIPGAVIASLTICPQINSFKDLTLNVQQAICGALVFVGSTYHTHAASQIFDKQIKESGLSNMSSTEEPTYAPVSQDHTLPVIAALAADSHLEDLVQYNNYGTQEESKGLKISLGKF